MTRVLCKSTLRVCCVLLLLPAGELSSLRAAGGSELIGSDSGASQGQPSSSKQKKSPATPASDDPAFSEAVAKKLLGRIRDGLVSRDEAKILSAFDSDRMPGFEDFKDNLDSLLNQYDSLRMYFHVTDTTSEGSKGLALVEVELEEIPRTDIAPPIRKSAQLRLEVERGGKEWKIVDFQPRDFFSGSA